MIDKNAMALYVRVVEHLSFSKAAKKEGIPVSTVSRKIAELERQIGVRLLERTTRALRMTQVGRDYFEQCQRGLAAFDAANALVADHQHEVRGRLRLSAPPGLSDVLVVPAIERFQRRYPDVEIRCFVTDRHIDHIADAVDLSIRAGEVLTDSTLVARRLLRYRSILVATPAYLGRAGEPRGPEDLKAHTTVAFTNWDQPTLAWSLTKGERIRRITVEPSLAINDYSGVRQAALSSMGVCRLPAIFCHHELEQGTLVEVIPDWALPTVTVYALYPSRRHVSAVVRLFGDHCAEHFATWAASVQLDEPESVPKR